MKKQIVALAVAGAFIGSAYAANVNVYGVVDTGLVYTKSEFGGSAAEAKDTDSFSLDSGVLAGSRFGFKGTEDLGDGYSVEFQLESGFSVDSGKFADENRLFNREARLGVNTPYGTFSFGRMGALTSGAGTYDIFMSGADALDGGNDPYIGTGYWFSRARYDNMITYVTPEANGFTGYAQYSFNASGTEDASVRKNTRYMALGLTYSAGPLNVVAVADMLQYSNAKVDELNAPVPKDNEDYTKYQDAKAISFGVNYDFGVTKAFFGAQYGKNEALDVSSFKIVDPDSMRDKQTFGYDVVDGYNLSIGAVTPLPCGELSAVVYYGDYESVEDSSDTAKKYGVALMHTYAISKRTKFYTGVGFSQFDIELKDKDDATEAARSKNFEFTIGLNHKF